MSRTTDSCKATTKIFKNKNCKWKMCIFKNMRVRVFDPAMELVIHQLCINYIIRKIYFGKYIK